MEANTFSEIRDSLAAVDRFSILVDDYHGEKKIATSGEMNELASKLAVVSEIKGCSYGARPFSRVAVNWWRCTELDVRLAISELRAKLKAELAANISPKPHPGDEARGGSEELIPTEFRSKPKSKDILARLHSGERQDNPSQYLKRAGVRTEGKPNSKLWIADIRDFDKTAHKELLS